MRRRRRGKNFSDIHYDPQRHTQYNNKTDNSAGQHFALAMPYGHRWVWFDISIYLYL